MKLPKDYKEIIENSVQGDWFHLGKRLSPPLPVLYKIVVLVSPEAKKLYGTLIPMLSFFDKGFVNFKLHAEEYKKSAIAINKILFSYSKFKIHNNKTVEFCNKAVRESKFFFKKDWKNQTKKKIWNAYQKTVDNYARSFLYGYVTWAAKVLEHEAMKILEKNTSQLSSLGLDTKKAFSILVKPKVETPYGKKEKALHILRDKFSEIIEQIKNSKVDENLIKENFPRFHSSILNFLKKYEWVGYDYLGPVFSYEEAVKVLFQDGKKEEKTASKKDIIKVCKFTNDEKQIFDSFSLVVRTKDVRNSTDDFVHFALDNFYSEIGREKGLENIEIRNLWPEELEELYMKGKNFSREYLKEKIDFCQVNKLPNSGDESSIGDKARLTISRLLKLDETEEKQNTKEFRGISASSGKVIGFVNIINSFGELDAFKDGEVLVSTMTSPRFMNAIKKCSAIVTDEGGLTCHAAIIAREFRIPCIVGTKIATRVLKNGDKVEVDAYNGSVKKL